MKLSENFFLSEFIKSQTSERLGISNQPTPEHLDNLIALCKNVLQPVRNHFKDVVTINSGYRSPELNKHVGGVDNSQHSTGEAADIEILSLPNYDVAKWIEQNLVFDQLILEFAQRGDPNAGWVHVSYSKKTNRKQCLTAMRENGKVVYLNGLIKP